MLTFLATSLRNFGNSFFNASYNTIELLIGVSPPASINLPLLPRPRYYTPVSGAEKQ